MNPGEYNRKLVVERKVPHKKGAGNVPAMGDAAYEPTGKKFFASRRQLRASERIVEGETTATAETEWKTWYRSDVFRSDRLIYKRRLRDGNAVTYDTEIHEITDVYADADHRELTILTRQVRAK